MTEENGHDTGGAGGMCSDFKSLRSDARLAARLLSLGVVSEEIAAKLIRKAFVMASKAKQPRNFKAAMSVPLAVAQLEQRERIGSEENKTPIQINNIIVQQRAEQYGLGGPSRLSGLIGHNGNGHAGTNGNGNGSSPHA